MNTYLVAGAVVAVLVIIGLIWWTQKSDSFVGKSTLNVMSRGHFSPDSPMSLERMCGDCTSCGEGFSRFKNYAQTEQEEESFQGTKSLMYDENALAAKAWTGN